MGRQPTVLGRWLSVVGVCRLVVFKDEVSCWLGRRTEGEFRLIQIIEGLPDNVVGLEAVGEIRAGDYKSTLDPAVDKALAADDKIRLLYVLGNEFTGYSGGAMWEDTKLGVSHWSSWEKIALVTDHKGYEDGVKAFAWMMPCEVRVFAVADLSEAKTWVAH
jgi:hypothetical protein